MTFLAFAAPNAIIFLIFTDWPILYSAYLSVTKWNFIAPIKKFVGFDNYIKLFQDPVFWQVAKNTLIFTLAVVFIAQSLAFMLALLLNKKIPGQSFFRTAAFTPYITTTAAAALVFVILLDPKLGPLSLFYQILGVQGPQWLASNQLALWAVIVVGIWKEIGFSSVFFLAGLKGINPEYFEAAQLDGANGLQILSHITIPLMTPTIFFLMVSGIIASMKKFDIVAVMTQGGPVYPASSTFVYHIYRLAFTDFKAGYASAFSMIFFILIIALTVFQLNISNRWVNYDN